MEDFEYEDYDFDYVEEYSSAPPAYAYSTSNQGETVRNKYSRAEEILSKNKNISSKSQKNTKHMDDEKDNDFPSIASSWDNLMKDFKLGEDYDDNVISASVEVSPAEKKTKDDFNFTTTSMSEDSFELNSADFEVGTIANRRSMEKNATRNSMTGLPTSANIPLKSVSSPDVNKSKKADKYLDLESYSLRPPDSGDHRNMKGAFQMSTALSSIALEKADYPPDEDRHLYHILSEAPALEEKDLGVVELALAHDVDDSRFSDSKSEELESELLAPETSSVLQKDTLLEYSEDTFHEDSEEAKRAEDASVNAGILVDHSSDVCQENDIRALRQQRQEDPLDSSHQQSNNAFSSSASSLYNDHVRRSDEDGVVQQQDVTALLSKESAEGGSSLNRTVFDLEPAEATDEEPILQQELPTPSVDDNESSSVPREAPVESRLDSTLVSEAADETPRAVLAVDNPKPIMWSHLGGDSNIQGDISSLMDQLRDDAMPVSDGEDDEEVRMLQSAGVLQHTSPPPLSYIKPQKQVNIVPAISGTVKRSPVSNIKAKALERASALSRKPASDPPVRPPQQKQQQLPKKLPVASRAGDGSTARAGYRYSHDDSSSAPVRQTMVSPSRPSKLPSRRNPSVEARRASSHTADIILPSKGREAGVRASKEAVRLSSTEKELQSREEALQAREALLDIAIRSALSEVSLSNQATARTVDRTADRYSLVDTHDIEEAGRSLAIQASEMETLKAQLFDLQSSLQSNASAVIPGEILAIAGESLEKTAVIESVPVAKGPVKLSRAQYDKMQREIVNLDALVVGFQRENEKMVAALKERQVQEVSHKARFFDEREHLNRELNMYKNAAPLGASAVGKSADLLRDELEKDALIRSLRERAAEAEAGAGVREKELHTLIDKLRAENRQLIMDLNRATLATNATEAGQRTKTEEELKASREEVESLRAKLLWYAENQELVDKGDQERLDLLADLRVCRRELRTLGVDLKDLNLVTKPGGAGKSAVADESLLSSDHAVKPPRSAAPKILKLSRNPADIKRIKELEVLVKELKEAILRRHPDSLAALIQASSTSDSVQLQQRERESELAAVREEVVQAREAGEKKLRALRQEHERIKLQYEARIAALPKQQTIAGNATEAQVGRGPRSASGQPVPIKNMIQAQARIKELEGEVDKVRTFYQRKVAELQERHKRGILAIRKGEDTGAELPADYVIESTAQKKDSPALDTLATQDKETELTPGTTTAPTAPQSGVEGVNTDAASPHRQLSSSKEGLAAPSTSPVFGLTNDLVGLHFQQQQQQFNQQQLMIAQQQNQIQQLDHLMRTTALGRALQEPLAEVKADTGNRTSSSAGDDTHRIELDLLQARIKSQESTISSLQSEVRTYLVKNAQLQMEVEASRCAPKAPQMEQFRLLEGQLEQLESRLLRRERELLSAAEESRTASRVERSRLESLHKQEMREKDEQLLRFKLELESLVSDIRHQVQVQ